MIKNLSIAELILLVGALTGLVGAIAAATVTIITAVRKVNEMVPVLAKIEAHVNSKETKLVGDVVARDLEIVLLRQMNAELRNNAALLAQAKAVTDIGRTRVSDSISSIPLADNKIVETLKEVKEDTVIIAENTAKTEKDMKELKGDKGARK